ncbi:MAG TPA: hypothetical protein VJA21_26720 [Verrucomicrobiae bacterium]
MKTAQIFISAGFLAGVVALGWQAHAIKQLQTEVAGLRKDLRSVLETALDKPTAAFSDPDQNRRDKLELIKLRNEVRELKEGMAESHARERMANVRTIVRSVLPTPAGAGGWKIRPEWKGMEAHATNQYAQEMKALAGATNEYVRFLNLDRAAKISLAVGRTEEARQFARDMLVLDDKYSRGDPEKANGDAVHDGHLVLGLIASDEGQVEEAKRHLLAAGKSRGSPVLGSFGPNMSLAKELLEKGEQETVLQYLESCRKFWGSGSEKLDEWTKDIQAGRIPNFGGNLIY